MANPRMFGPVPMVQGDDLEGQGVVAASRITEQYGATEQTKSSELASCQMKDPKSFNGKLPLLLGYFDVSPSKIFLAMMGLLVAFFAMHRLADVAYFATVDAEFPAGLEHLYPSKWEQQQTVSYTRHSLICSTLHKIIVFCVVVALIYFAGFARADDALRACTASLGAWCGSEDKFCGGCFSCCNWWKTLTSLLSWCFSALCWPLRQCCSPFHVCLVGFGNRIGLKNSWRELLHGSLYLTLFAALFLLISAPFRYWMQIIELKYGFSNSLTASTSVFTHMMAFRSELVSLFVMGIPGKFLFLAVLQCRHGWLFMWAVTVGMVLFVQSNMSWLAPHMMDMTNPFPSEMFAVGRGFPFAPTNIPAFPFLSLNRIYFKDPESAAIQFVTKDHSIGQLVLTSATKADGSGHPWAIQARGSNLPWMQPTLYAQTIASIPQEATSRVLESLQAQSWTLGAKEAHVGARHGEELREKVFGFAKERNITIAEIYMVDGSHKDPRANAFVAGSGGNGSVIGLFDTLFLGEHASDTGDEEKVSPMQELTKKDSAITLFTEAVQDVDTREEDGQVPQSSAPTQAMTDDEIVAILGHELGHVAMGHLSQSSWVSATTSFVTFAALGWTVHSPLVAAALTLTLPVLHVSACVYDHILGPPLEGLVKLFTDGLTRHNEYEADAYVAKISEKYGDALQSSLAKLTVSSNQDPDLPWFYEALHADHPTFAHRWEHIEATKRAIYGKNVEK